MDMPTATETERHAKIRAMCDARAGLLPSTCDLAPILASTKKTQLLCDNALLNAIALMHDNDLTIDMASFAETEDRFVPYRNGQISFDHLFGSINRLGFDEPFPNAPLHHAAIIAMLQLLRSGLFNAYVGTCDRDTLTVQYVTGPIAKIPTVASWCPLNDILDNMPTRVFLEHQITSGGRRCSVGESLFRNAVQYDDLHLLNRLLASRARCFTEKADAAAGILLPLALREGSLATAERLLEYGLHQGGRSSPYHRHTLEIFSQAARSLRSREAIHILCEYGLAENLDRRDSDGNNVLHLVVPHIDKTALQYLLANGAARLIDTPNAVGDTPVMTAIRHARWGVLPTLIEHERAIPALMPRTAQPVPRSLLTLQLHRELHGNVSARQMASVVRNRPVSEDMLARRQAIADMPFDTLYEQRDKLVAMSDPRAGLLPATTDVERILSCPAKTEFLCCDSDVLDAIARMHDGGHTIRMEPFYALAEQFVPVWNGQIDLTSLIDTVVDVLTSEMDQEEQAGHPAIRAFEQLLGSGLLNGYISSDLDALSSIPLALGALFTPELTHLLGREKFLAALDNTPDAPLLADVTALDTPAPPLLLACTVGDLEVARRLIARGANCNIMTAESLTPLVVAAAHDNPELIELLLSNGAARTLNAPAFRVHAWMTPLCMATAANAPATVRYLLESGALHSNFPRSTPQATPLHVAAQDNNVDIAKLLLQFGAAQSLTYRDYEQRTPLHIAASRGNTAVLQLLLENGGAAHMDSRGTYSDAKRNVYAEGLTPLMCAVYSGTPETINVLLMHAPARHLDETDAHGNTAIDIAKQLGQSDIVALLKLARAQDRAVRAMQGS